VHVNALARLFRGRCSSLIDAHDVDELTFFSTHAGLADKSAFGASSPGRGASNGCSFDLSRRPGYGPSCSRAYLHAHKIANGDQTLCKAHKV
jgi:hypothetical protein